MRVAIYIRVSTTEQAEEGFSIEGQKRRLLAYVESQDWTIAGIYIDEGISAKDMNRPKLQQMLTDMEQDLFDCVLVYKLDRLTRSASDCDGLLKRFEAHKVVFQSATESFETRTATGRLFIRLISELAQWERELISERTRAGMEQMVVEGKKPGGRYPYGYDKNGQIVEEEAEVIRHIRRLYMQENMSLRQIALALPPRRGFLWTPGRVADVLENIFYAGVIRYGTKLPNGKFALPRKRDLLVECLESAGTHTPIWTREEYDEHVRLLRSRSEGGWSRNQTYWFTGLLKCGRCGAAMFGKMNKGNSPGAGTPTYLCHRKHHNRSCDMPMFSQRHIEHLIFDHIDSIVLDSALTDEEQKANRKKSDYKEKEVIRIKRDLEAVRERIKKWQYMFVNDLLGADDLRERLNEEAEKQKELNKALSLLGPNKGQNDVTKQQLLHMRDIWPTLDDGEKQEALRILFESITVHTPLTRPKGVRNRFFESSVEVVYR
ncbi:recombinase family protein [Gordoniibacillus kamchatkensis]|uniref:recombinase family protein n=1 Tax=Gordoniibacillus kamchatkensis TaxID=1590651 RepID=UPI000696485F|nr:recombinase family protein [Paenibacillus sp. VKM B-2647]